MKKFFTAGIILACLTFIACGGGGGKESAKSIAQKWCDLNAKVHKAPDGGPEYGEAKAALDKYEKEIEAKYDETFMKEVGKEVEKCEDASEGR